MPQRQRSERIAADSKEVCRRQGAVDDRRKRGGERLSEKSGEKQRFECERRGEDRLHRGDGSVGRGGSFSKGERAIRLAFEDERSRPALEQQRGQAVQVRRLDRTLERFENVGSRRGEGSGQIDRGETGR